jgi:hypothetical protein
VAREVGLAAPRALCLALVLVSGCHRDPTAAAESGGSALPCGPHVCDARDSYCEVIKTDAPELPSDYACRPLPPACTAESQPPSAPPLSCDCFPAATKCQYCVHLDLPGAHGFRRMCVGGR